MILPEEDKLEHYLGKCLISTTKGRRRYDSTFDTSRYYGAPLTPFPTPDMWHSYPMVRHPSTFMPHTGWQYSQWKPFVNLVVYKEGFPLIQRSSYQENRHKGSTKRAGISHIPEKVDNKSKENVTENQTKSHTPETGTEGFLPRIIRPRKRRKKGRKPENVDENQTVEKDVPVTTSSENRTIQAETPEDKENSLSRWLEWLLEDLAFSSRDNLDLNNNNNEIDININSNSSNNNNNNNYDYSYNNSSDNGLSFSRCKCAYCDPKNVTWNARDIPGIDKYKEWPVDIFNSSAWNEPASSQQLEILSPTSAPTCSIASAPIISSASSSRGRIANDNHHEELGGGLRISSEIVTSPNGHRDIEIKFFSSTDNDDSSFFSPSSSWSSSSSLSFSSLSPLSLFT